MRELTIAGAGAVVLPSLLEEQIVRVMIQNGEIPCVEERLVAQSGSPRFEDNYNGGVHRYLQTLASLKNCTGVPIIANLNGCTHGGWLSFASKLEAAGADAIELSIYTDLIDPAIGADAVEESLLHAIESVCRSVSIPVAVKLLPFFTSLPNLAVRIADAGAAGIVLFGREPSWEVSDGALRSSSHWSLSGSGQLQTTLSGLIRIRPVVPRLSVAASGGISTAKDVIHTVIAGADVAMVTSEIYRNGPEVIAHILEGVTQCLDRQGMQSFDEFVRLCRSRHERHGSRRNQLHAMLDTDRYRDPSSEPVTQHGDQWGHIYPAPLDD